MKKFTIIIEGGFVCVDGEGYSGIDLSELAAENIHAIQFYGSYGEVEFAPVFDAETKRVRKAENAVFGADGVRVFQRELDRWAVAKQQAEAQAAAAPQVTGA